MRKHLHDEDEAPMGYARDLHLRTCPPIPTSFYEGLHGGCMMERTSFNTPTADRQVPAINLE
jgi:hypothetical protein